MNILRAELRSTHSARLERWLGADRIEQISRGMLGWYWKPIPLLDVPGCVAVCGDGDFIGPFGRGSYFSAADALEAALLESARSWRARHNLLTAMAGFANVSEALQRDSQGYGQTPGGQIKKIGPTGVIGVTSSLWRVGPQPAVGATPAAAPGGTVFTKDSTGALKFVNPASGTLHLVGADMAASVINNSLLLYDLLFGVAKLMNSTATEAVTGVPTRYQNTVPGSGPFNPDYVGGNFLFVQVGGTALPATAHNWTVCQYKDQDDAASNLPSLTGNASAIVDRLDHPVQEWFAPLNGGDVGVKALTQMQCSALVATGVIWFMIGHPIGFMSFPVINSMLPFDWLTNRRQVPRVFNDACLAFLELMKPATTTATYGGQIYVTAAAA